MMSKATMALTNLRQANINEQLIDNVVDVFYNKLLDDFAINRLFSGKPIAEQTRPLKVYLKAVIKGLNDPDPDKLTDLIDDCFMAAFAKTDSKTSPMAGDFDFLMEIAGGKDMRILTPLCDAHSHFLKFRPDDFHYDVVMNHVTDTLKEIPMSDELHDGLLALAEGARDAVLGRQAA